MKIIEYHFGCNATPLNCMGPWNNYYTIFGTELRFLYSHLFIAFFISLILSIISYKKFSKNIIITFLIFIGSLVVFFLSFAYIFPVRVLY